MSYFICTLASIKVCVNGRLRDIFTLFIYQLTKRFAYAIHMSMNPQDLIEWRKRNEYTQVKLAEALGVHPMTVSKWERSVHRKEIPSFLHLALDALECKAKEVKKVKGTKTKKEV
jgi:DNA-binding transcriptional regulator YiaG